LEDSYSYCTRTSATADRYLPQNPAAGVSTSSTVRPAQPTKVSSESLLVHLPRHSTVQNLARGLSETPLPRSFPGTGSLVDRTRFRHISESCSNNKVATHCVFPLFNIAADAPPSRLLSHRQSKRCRRSRCEPKGSVDTPKESSRQRRSPLTAPDGEALQCTPLA
jgi:hypothetical protein